MPTIRVLRPFVFSRLDANGRPREDIFQPGEREIDEEMADHPWIARDFADGCIENPAQAKFRAEAAQAAAKKADEEARYFLKQAETTFARVEALASQSTADAGKARQALDTPINQLGADGAKSLNTPVSKLRAQQGSGPDTAAAEAAKADDTKKKGK